MRQIRRKLIIGNGRTIKERPRRMLLDSTSPLRLRSAFRRALSAPPGWHGSMLALALMLYLPLLAQDLPTLQGTVTRVVDGDTIDVLLASGPIRVRLNGIDAPEKNQPMGTEATLTLSNLVNGTKVLLEPFEQDKYDRMIATVFRGDLDVNAEMVRLGYAWAYRRYLKSSNAEFCALEFAARKARMGLWSRPATDWIAPWEWRRLKTREDPTDYSRETAGSCAAAIGRKSAAGLEKS